MKWSRSAGSAEAPTRNSRNASSRGITRPHCTSRIASRVALAPVADGVLRPKWFDGSDEHEGSDGLGLLSGRIVADVRVASQQQRAVLNLGGTVREPQVRN